MDIPKNKNIDEIYDIFKNKDNISMNGLNSGGFEAKIGSNMNEWVFNIVEQNNIRFDNPARLKAGHPYILILPTNDVQLET